MDDGTEELTIDEVIELLRASQSTAYEMVELTEENEHAAIFASIAGLTNVMIEVIKRLAEIGEPVDVD